MTAPKERKYPRDTRYLGEDFDVHDGVAVERNGNLTWVEDAMTGEGDWKAPFEVDQ